jgi:hypothetical protein
MEPVSAAVRHVRAAAITAPSVVHLCRRVLDRIPASARYVLIGEASHGTKVRPDDFAAGSGPAAACTCKIALFYAGNMQDTTPMHRRVGCACACCMQHAGPHPGSRSRQQDCRLLLALCLQEFYEIRAEITKLLIQVSCRSPPWVPSLPHTHTEGGEGGG